MSKILSLILVFLTVSTLHAQSFLKTPAPSNSNLLLQLQKSFEEWSNGKNLQNAKGWKYYKRWETEQVIRADGKGNFANYDDYFSYAQKRTQLYRDRLVKGVQSGEWSPAGPFDLPGSYDTTSQHGLGRINCVAFHPTDPNILWVGVAQGGIWKSVNNGQSWISLNNDLPIYRISDIVVDPAHPDTIYISLCDFEYIGTALQNDQRKRNTHYGMGVYKTTDGGITWFPTGLAFNMTDFDGSLIRRIFVNPFDADELIAVGTSGVWKSFNAGNSWNKILDTLIGDLQKNPLNPNTLYASGAYVERLGKGYACILKSTDFGDTWTLLNAGIPPRSEVQRVDTNFVYAITCDINSGFYGLYLSTDNGDSWNLQSQTPNILEWWDGNNSGGQGLYDLALIVNSENPDIIYAGGVNMWTSENGGISWEIVSEWTGQNGKSLHADLHQFAYNPLNKFYYVCNDGGIYFTSNIIKGSVSEMMNNPQYRFPTNWKNITSGLPVTSFYRVAICRNKPGYILSGAQDNGTSFYNTQLWMNIFGGDGMDNFIDLDDPDVLGVSYQYGQFYISYDGGLNFNYFTPTQEERGEWTTPVVLDPANSGTVYIGYGNLWKSNDFGTNWNRISDFSIIPDFGYPNLITSIAVSPANPSVIYVAKRVYHLYNQPGELWVTQNDGATWKDITTGLPDSLYFTSVVADDDDPGVAWVSCGGFINGVKIFKTTDGGITWQNISLNLPNLPVNCIVTHSGTEKNPVYIGTDLGVFYLNDDMTSWELYSNNLPNVIVTDLEIQYSEEKLYASTFGRGIWVADLRDLSVGIQNDFVSNPIEIKVLPNRNVGKFMLEIKNLPAGEKTFITIVDVMGRNVFNEESEIVNGTFCKSYHLQLLPGNYFVKYSLGNQTHVSEFTVIR